MDSVIDTSVLEQLKDMLGDDFVLILDSFRDEGKSLIESMETGYTSLNMNLIREAAHSMKSMSGNLGAMGLSELSDRLQIAAVNEDAELVADLWPQLKTLYYRALEELQNSA